VPLGEELHAKEGKEQIKRLRFPKGSIKLFRTCFVN